MEKKDLIKELENGRFSAVDIYYNLKDDIVKQLGNSELAKKVKEIKSAIDLFSMKEEIIAELSGKPSKIKEEKK